MDKNIQYNLVYMAKPPYGGWITFTAHLSKKNNFNIYKIGNRTEKRIRPFGYDVNYQNLDIDTLLKKPNLLITAIDKKYYKFLPLFNEASIVIHDPTELKEPVLKEIKRFNVFTIRKTVNILLKEKYNINNTFIHHPFYKFYKDKIPYEKKSKALSISRIDFDKNIDMIIDANDILGEEEINVEIYGSIMNIYEFHKMRPTNFRKYYKGRFPKEFNALINLLEPCKFLIDMSAIQNDGGGSQYTFLEAIHMDCALILNKKWIENVDTVFKDKVNCFIVESAQDIVDILKSNPDTSEITKNAKKILEPHI